MGMDQCLVLFPILNESLFTGWGVLWYRSKHHGFKSHKDQYKRQSGVEADQFGQLEKDDEGASFQRISQFTAFSTGNAPL